MAGLITCVIIRPLLVHEAEWQSVMKQDTLGAHMCFEVRICYITQAHGRRKAGDMGSTAAMRRKVLKHKQVRASADLSNLSSLIFGVSLFQTKVAWQTTFSRLSSRTSTSNSVLAAICQPSRVLLILFVRAIRKALITQAVLRLASSPEIQRRFFCLQGARPRILHRDAASRSSSASSLKLNTKRKRTKQSAIERLELEQLPRAGRC